VRPAGAAAPAVARDGTAYRRGTEAIRDRRVIHITAAVSYRETGSYVATLRHQKVPERFRFGRVLVSANGPSEDRNVALLHHSPRRYPYLIGN